METLLQINCHRAGYSALQDDPLLSSESPQKIFATTDFELLYYQKIPSLISNADNWLLLDSPDVYLYGALLHSAPYLAEDERVAIWAQMYSASVARLNEASELARYSGSGLKLKIRGLG